VLFPIVREGVYPTADFKRIEMINWTALLGLMHGVKVRHTTRNWIVHVEALYGHYPGELFALAKNLADRVARGLMSKYGCLLGEGRVGRGYELAVDDPVAQLLSRYFTVSTPKRKMDHSLGELEGEIDHLSRDAAVEYLLMPERVKKLGGQVEALAGVVEELRGDLHELVLVLKEALAPKENHAQPLKDRRYIT